MEAGDSENASARLVAKELISRASGQALSHAATATGIAGLLNSCVQIRTVMRPLPFPPQKRADPLLNRALIRLPGGAVQESSPDSSSSCGARDAATAERDPRVG